MVGFTDEFNEHSDALREARKRDDFDNLQHTYSGVETGQQTRHGLTKDTSGSVTGGKRKSVSDIVRETLDWLLLNNPEYARIHGEAMSALRGAEDTADSALDKTLEALETARAELQDMLDRAPTLPDGRKVFRDGSTGYVYDADGLLISDDLAAGIEWPEGAADNRDYTAKKQDIEELEQSERELRGMQTELGGIRGELTNNEKPPTPERVETLRGRIETLHQQSVDALANHVGEIASPTAAPDTGDTTSTITLPTMPKTIGN